MLKGLYYGAAAVLLLMSEAVAQNDVKEGVQSFQQESGAWRRQEQNKVQVLQTITDSVGKSAIDNITGAEQVFCYQVTTRPNDYNGYTINGMALTGFCGVVNAELKNMIETQLFATASNIDFNTTEQCVIKPKLMLRFVRGIDATDVLISAPCHSVAIFYAGKAKAYNFKPGAEILDVMVESFKGQTVPFTSPAMLNQLLPIGVPQTAAQQKMVAGQKQAQPIRNWEEPEMPQQSKTTEPVKKSGWNNVKVNVGR